jgi:hypothetical protein
MKLLTKHTTLFTILLSLFTFNGCKDDCPPCDDPTNPECENYDPCWGKDTINTFFKVRPGDNGFKPPEEWCDLVACDTFNASSVRFDMPDGNPDNSTYEWQIGSEAETRTEKGFEVDFSDYLRTNSWETWIPITLTIRTPINDCLKSEDETIKTVTRNLFFTENQIAGLFTGFTNKEEVYIGTLNDNPNPKISLIQQVSGDFRGYSAPLYLMIGLPHIDTLVFPTKCNWSEGCESFRQTRVKYLAYQSCMQDVSHYLSESNNLFSSDRTRLELDLTFDPPEGKKQFNFNGLLVE